MVMVDYGNKDFAETDKKKLELINTLRGIGKDKIHEIYQLPDRMDVDGCCEVRDIKIAETIYREYFDGMVKFTREVLILDNNDTAVVDRFKEELDKADSKDKDFIDGLFSPACTENVSCISILKNNLDYICDMTATIEKYKNEVNTLISAFDYEDSQVKTVSVDFMKTSVNYFLQSMIHAIDKSLNIMIDNKEKVLEKVDDRKFTLFI